MKLAAQEVRYVAELANLSLSENEVAQMSHDLGEILTHMEQLNELETVGTEPMAQLVYAADETASLREDVAQETLSNREALANAAESGSGYYKVPLVIER